MTTQPSDTYDPELIRLREALRLDGPCTYCGEPTSYRAADPAFWPLHFADDDSGRVKPHHTGCVTSRLNHRQRLIHVVEIARVMALTREMAAFYRAALFPDDPEPSAITAATEPNS